MSIWGEGPRRSRAEEAVNLSVETAVQGVPGETSSLSLPGGCFLVLMASEELWEPPSETQLWPAVGAQSSWADTLSQR